MRILLLFMPLLLVSCAPHPVVKETAVPSKPSGLVEPDHPKGGDALRDRELAELAAPLVDAFQSSEGKQTPDGRHVIFVSDREGAQQLYVANAAQPDAAPRRLTASREKVSGPVPTLDGKAVLFRSDQGANELWRIYRINLDGTGLVELTPGEELVRDTPHLVRDQPERMYYSARPLATGITSIYTQSALRPEPATALYTDPTTQPGELVCVSRDGKRGVLARVPALSDVQLFSIDFATKAVRQFHPAPGKKAGIFSATCSEDGSIAYLSTDGGGEEALVIAVEIETGRELARYRETQPSTARIPEVQLSRDGATLALEVSAGSHTEIKILDAKTLKSRVQAKLPLGSGQLGNISTDGKSLTVTWTTADSPNDLFRIDTESGAVTPLSRVPCRGLASLAPVEVKLTRVTSFDGTEVPVNLYLPAGTSGAGGGSRRLPVVFWIHGGPANNSAVRWRAQFRLLLSQGYAIVEPNVRGSTGFGRAYALADDGPRRMDAVRDLEQVALWVGSQPWADKQRMAVMGLSYGGYMVLMALTHQPKLWRAGVDLFGIVNLRTFIASTSGTIRELFRLEFGELEKDGAFFDTISPIHYVDRIVAPLFVYAGKNDPRVPRAESDQIVAALRARKSPVEYMVAEREGHSMHLRENQIEFIARVARFLETHLR